MKKASLALLAFSSLLLLQFVDAEQSLASPSADITVTTTADELNGDGDCSLREAIESANTNTSSDACTQGSNGTDTIIIPSGTYSLSIAGASEDGNQTGDLDITEALVIVGDGATTTIIDGNQLDRVFHIIPSAPKNVVVEISDVTVRDGKVETVGEGGAGILVKGSLNSLNLHDCIVRDNQAKFPSGTNITSGGGLDNYNATMVVTNCSITNNSADRGGGVYTDGTTEIYRSVIDNNDARLGGGGLDSSGDSVSDTTYLENVTISNNAAPTGSGVFNDGTISLLNVTLVYNGLSSTGAGFSNTNTAEDSAVVKNSLVAFNSDDLDTNCSGTITSNGYNLENDNTCGFTSTGDQENMDPLIDLNLQDNGGPTFTHSLLMYSPAIDTGSGCPDFDQRGVNRPIDGDHDGTPDCDIGAFEAPLILFLPLISK
jgi:CSLREA domain-containing protein